MAKKESTELVPAAPTVLAAAPAHIAHGRDGFNTVDANDVMFERLALMQDLSPDVKERKYQVGDIVRRSTEEVLYTRGGKPVKFTLAYYWKEYVEFGDRNDPNSPVVLAKTLDRTSELAERSRRWDKKKAADGRMVRAVTDVHNFIILLQGRPTEPMLVSCMRTNMRHGSGLLTLCSSRGDHPLFAGSYLMVSEDEHNRKNQTYSVFKFRNDMAAPWSDEAMYAEAEKTSKLLAELAKSNKLSGDYSKDDAASHDGDGDGAPEAAAGGGGEKPKDF